MFPPLVKGGRALACLTALLMPLACTGTGDDIPGAAEGPTVRAPAPVGSVDQDRANLQAVFDSVRPGDTVLLEGGTYVVGAGLRLTVPDVTVLGHEDGTVLRGCEPEVFDFEPAGFLPVVLGCTGLVIRAQRQTIRGLTFEYAWHGIIMGPYPETAEEFAAMQSGAGPEPFAVGGQRIEGNTFRSTPNGMRVLGVGDEVSIVRDNDFIDNFHAMGIYGPPLHFTGNRVTVSDPPQVPTSGYPGSSILVAAEDTDCSGHVVADNVVEGPPGIIYVMAARGDVCRDVEIRNNVLRVARVQGSGGWVIPVTEEDPTVIGVPITVAPQDLLRPWLPDDTPAGRVENVTVVGNQIHGAEGIGILVRGSGHRIEGNTIRDIRVRSPFPGNNWSQALVTWEAGNGSGIWVGPDGRANRIVGNIFEDIEGPSITVEGADNAIELASPEDSVNDLGSENRVTEAGSGGDR